MRIKGWKLDFFESGEWQVIEERLEDMNIAGVPFNPSKKDMFKALDLVPFDKVRVMIIGQDPYPNSQHCTGVAFSIPKEIPKDKYPPTLKNILEVYCKDLYLPEPPSGDLTSWCKEGVLLWNAFPSCDEGKPKSHEQWPEWPYLTKEIIQKLDKRDKPVVFVFLGAVAREFAKYVTDNDYIETSHPSPLGASKGFMQSRLFTTINAYLKDWGEPVVNWRLNDADMSEAVAITSRRNASSSGELQI